MPYHADLDPPRVFLSFAGQDRRTAERLSVDLNRCGIGAFVDAHSIAPGCDLVLAIDRALNESDYYVLLWSHHCIDHPWVDAEWSAAFMRGMNERRVFFFVVRLDDTPLPRLLAARKYLDAFGGWDAVVAELVTAWNRDRATGTQVFPAPGQVAVTSATDTRTIVLYVRNQALAVSHVIAVPVETTGGDLLPLVRSALMLPERQTKFSGIVGMQFEYELRNDGEVIIDRPLTNLNIADGSTIDLIVQVGLHSRGATVSTWTFRTLSPTASTPPVVTQDGHGPDGVASINPRTIRALINSAFGHLTPSARAIEHIRNG